MNAPTQKVAMAKNDNNKIDVANAADSDPTGLRMDPARSARFTSITSRMARAIYSLEAASKLMEGLDFNKGEVNPAATVQAFCGLLSKDIDLMYQMLNNTDKPESDASKGGEATENIQTPDPLDRWIKITPETLPEHEQPVQVWCETWGRAEPVFYDHELEIWCRLFDNGSTLFEVEMPKYYRIGSRPAVEQGGA